MVTPAMPSARFYRVILKVLIQNNEQLELVREEIRLVTVIFFPFLIMLSFLLSLHKKDHGITTHIYYFPFFSTSDVLQIFRQIH
ncbi:hypothetical protein V6Z12_A11G342200 [Gossypium hirsutum]